MATIKSKYFELKQGKSKFVLTKLSARVVTAISYAAIRNQSTEEGAVQRVLNPRRIASIREFTLAGGDYPSALVLNWVSEQNKLIRSQGGVLTIKDSPFSAQIIDGQHRIAGIRAAIEDDANIGKLELPVVIYENLTTEECANIFISINTEQKPVPRSLVFDLYGVASDAVVDRAAVRARDIAMALNEDEDSPYHQLIRLPNSSKRKGGIALSTVVNAIKPLVDEKGDFEQVDVMEFETQRKIIENWMGALQKIYGDSWEDKSNVFMYAAGFTAAINFLRTHLIPYCNTNGGNYTLSAFSKAVNLEKTELILQNEVSGLSGSDSVTRVFERLKDAFVVKAQGKKKIAV
ncbi:DGQHR domain-containing protein [Burkholderia multivorans]|uniref:DGQHR domain-containing protein n=1 Tax=Burkholderia multivorans TaxID=87883 RepID=UPI0009BE7C62|nr:DGQHR domain-containing protein [Burkholderia multivorans]